MAQVNIEVNGRPYAVGCEDGQEASLRELAALFDGHVRQVAGQVGPLGETRLFLLGALTMADELAEVRAKLARAQAELNLAVQKGQHAEAKAAAAIEATAARIEALAAKAPA